MPFEAIGSFFSENIGSFADFGDVASIVDDFGTEFLSGASDLFTDFNVSLDSVADLGGFDIAGSFAGSADWFDTFNFGSILDSVPSIGDFSFSSFTDSLPSLSSIKDFAGSVSDTISTGYKAVKEALPSLEKIKETTAAVQKAIDPYVKTAQQITKTAQKIAPAVNAASSALGIQNPLAPILQPLSTATTLLTGASAAAAGVSSAASGLASTATKIENAASKTSSLFSTDPNASTARDVATGQPINTPREVSDDPFEQARLDAAAEADRPGPTEAAVVDQLGFVDRASLAVRSFGDDVADLFAPISGPATTQPRATASAPGATTDPYGLNILNAAETAQLTRNINPAFINSFADPGAAPTGLPPGVTSQYTSAYDPESGTWSVFDNISSTTVQSGLSEQAALLAEQDLNITSGIDLITSTTADEDPFEAARLSAEAASNAAGPTEADVLSAINGQTAALTNQARAQQSVRALRNTKAQATDWRVRLKLAPNSNYLYNVSPTEVGILAPLALTDGVIFPYTPSIETAYKANYDAYDLTHSNYRGYFYKSSHVDAVNVRGTFTAQDSKEADYLLAVIHFFRSCTKMFYGNDQQRGAPPPMLYLNGYGDYQFAEHPCVVSQFNYTLPPDVDYIRAQSTLSANTNQLNSRLRNPIANNPLSYSVNRLLNSNLLPGALDFRPTTPGSGNLATGTPTYVPTKMEISITLLPMQSRSQISNNFSVKEFSNGNLLKGGYW